MIIIQNIKEAVFMEKYITDERTGLRYELVGDYYLITGDDEPEEEQKPIGIWGREHLGNPRNNNVFHKPTFWTAEKWMANSEVITGQRENFFSGW